jgi:hypothetical protein
VGFAQFYLEVPIVPAVKSLRSVQTVLGFPGTRISVAVSVFDLSYLSLARSRQQ